MDSQDGEEQFEDDALLEAQSGGQVTGSPQQIKAKVRQFDRAKRRSAGGAAIRSGRCPATEDQITKLVPLALSGDKKARELIGEEIVALAKRLILRFPQLKPDDEDIVSICKRSGWKSLSEFNPTKGATFRTFAYNCMYCAVIRVFRTNRRSKKIIESSSIRINEFDEEFDLLEAVAADERTQPSCLLELAEERVRLDRLLTHLTLTEQVVITMSYGILDGQQCSQAEIARYLVHTKIHKGITEGRISQIKNDAIRKLKELTLSTN